MKFICTQSDLNTHLSLISRAVPSRPSHPVLANVLLVANEKNQQVSLTGFDLSLGVQTSFPAQIEDGGTVTLPARLLSDIVSRLPAGEITLETSEKDFSATLVCATGRYQVRGMSASDYPELPKVEDGDATTLSVDMLSDGLRGSLFAASGDETKQVLTGVHILAEAEELEFAATDGHRLAVVKAIDSESEDEDDTVAKKMKQATMSEFAVTVPGKALRELERMLQIRQAEDVALRFDQGQLIFEWEHQRLTSRLLEGQYPNYRQLVPKQFSRQMTVERRLFVGALERIAVLADQRNSIVKLNLDTDNQVVVISVDAQDVGSGQESVPAQISGDSLEIAFNVKYLLEGLKVFNTTEVQLQCNTATSPAIMVPLGGMKMTYLIMPVQIRS
jgi:DNA polymerase-3 subunit beta